MKVKYRDRFTPLISRLKKIAIKVEAEPNFYTLSSYALYENPVSDLMTLFMGKNSHIPAYLTRVLLNFFGDKRYTDDLVNITVLRCLKKIPIINMIGISLQAGLFLNV